MQGIVCVAEKSSEGAKVLFQYPKPVEPGFTFGIPNPMFARMFLPSHATFRNRRLELILDGVDYKLDKELNSSTSTANDNTKKKQKFDHLRLASYPRDREYNQSWEGSGSVARNVATQTGESGAVSSENGNLSTIETCREEAMSIVEGPMTIANVIQICRDRNQAESSHTSSKSSVANPSSNNKELSPILGQNSSVSRDHRNCFNVVVVFRNEPMCVHSGVTLNTEILWKISQRLSALMYAKRDLQLEKRGRKLFKQVYLCLKEFPSRGMKLDLSYFFKDISPTSTSKSSKERGEVMMQGVRQENWTEWTEKIRIESKEPIYLNICLDLTDLLGLNDEKIDFDGTTSTKESTTAGVYPIFNLSYYYLNDEEFLHLATDMTRIAFYKRFNIDLLEALSLISCADEKQWGDLLGDIDDGEGTAETPQEFSYLSENILNWLHTHRLIRRYKVGKIEFDTEIQSDLHMKISDSFHPVNNVITFVCDANLL